tara:strand:+ start:136 stop:570 length:435 start_codon:yes stop_codon:yes gene_type:complete
MVNQLIALKIIGIEFENQIIKLSKQLNYKIEEKVLIIRFHQMIEMENYHCFGLFEDSKLIGISNGWTTNRFYCGKQLEIDNLVIDEEKRSKGYGDLFIKYLENWCKKGNYETIELNSYVRNSKSHKFYFNHGFKIIGHHFFKEL